jgi:hypothetical protein
VTIPNIGSFGQSGLGFFADRTAVLKQLEEKIEKALGDRARTFRHFTNSEWETFDVGAQETNYQALLNEINSLGSRKEKLQDKKGIERILEKHLWAAWIRNREVHKTYEFKYRGERYGTFDEPVLTGFGTDINSRLVEIGVEAAAGVSLREQWYQYSSAGWEDKIDQWAHAYDDSIVK